MKKLLLIDDETHVQQLFSEAFNGTGHKVITASNGGSLLELAQQYQPDLIVMDVRVGDEDGLQLLQDLRNADYDGPVILYSAYSPYKDDLRSAAADAFVLKGKDPGELRHIVDAALQRSRRGPGGDGLELRSSDFDVPLKSGTGSGTGF